MNIKNNIVKHLKEQTTKVVEVTKSNYTLENGDIIEHTFDIDENITVEEFQQLLDNARNSMIELINNIPTNRIDE